jgi:transcriptional regulator with XRE-family HTH domain
MVSRRLSHGGVAGVRLDPMTSADTDRADYIRQLRAQGYSVPEVADAVGLSRSQVYRILNIIGDPAREEYDEDGDDDGDDGEEYDGAEALFDASGAEDPHIEPFTYCGEDPPGNRRYLDGNGASVSTLDLYRWLSYRRYDDDDHETAARVEADLAEQIAEYEQRAGASV